MNELRELRWAKLTLERLLAAVEAHVGLEVARTAESLAAHPTLVRFLSRVYEVVFLEVS